MPAATASRRGVCVSAAFLAMAAGALLAIQQLRQPRAADALLSRHLVDAEIRASRGLDSFWRGLDTRADREAQKVRALQRARYESGVGTRFESEEAERELRSASDWGRDGADRQASVWRREAVVRPAATTGGAVAASWRPMAARASENRPMGQTARDATVKFFQTAAEHPRAAREAMREIVGELASHQGGMKKKARVEELAEATLGKQTKEIVGKEMVRQANKGLFGQSLTGLVRNVFGGPQSDIVKYAKAHHARTGQYRWSALGEAHWDANGDPIVPKAAADDRGLAGAGVKTTNSLKELYKDVSGTAKAKAAVKGRGTMHLVRLMDNLLYGKQIKPESLRVHEKRKREDAQFARELAEHKFDNKMLVGKTNSFFGDDEGVDTEPNEALNDEIIAPKPVTAEPDASPVAKKLDDNEMLVSGNKGFFKDRDDENPMDKVLQAAKDSEQRVKAHEQRIQRNVREVQRLSAKAAKRRAEDVKDFKVVRAVEQDALDSEHAKDVKENRQLARNGDMDKFFSGVNGQAKGRAQVKKHRVERKHADALKKAERQVLRAEETAHQEESKVREDERRAEKERVEVREAEEDDKARKIQRRAVRQEEETAAEKALARDRARKREQLRAMRAESAIRAERAPSSGVSTEWKLEAREKPVRSGKQTEVHVSGSQEREAVSGYFDKLEKQDKYKHKLAVSVIHQEEKPRPAVEAWADGSDRRDQRRDDKFFDKIAREDEKKSELARDRRIQRRKDERSLDFYEAVDKTLKRHDGAARKARAVAPKAYREWEHAENAMGLNDGKKAVQHRGSSARLRHSPPQEAVSGAVQKPVVVAAAARKQAHAHAGMVPSVSEAALQAQIKAAIRSAVKRDVAQAVSSDVSKALDSRTSNVGNAPQPAAPRPAGSVSGGSVATTKASAKFAPAHQPARKGEQAAVTAATGYKSAYDYQKQHLAKVLDRGEPRAKKQLHQFLHDPMSAIASLF